MYHERLITGVAATLGAIAVVLTVVGLAGTPVALPVALAFAASAVLMYDQLSGRMAARVYRRVEQHARVDRAGSGDGRGRRRGRARQRRQRGDERGGFGAGPREEWTPPRDGATAREASTGDRRGPRDATGRRGPGGAASSGRRRATAGGDGPGNDGPSPAAAYRTLGLEPGADEAEIKRAYRERVKEVHPDTSGGDEAEFMAVKDAYERLTE